MTNEEILHQLNNVEFDSNGDPVYSYEQVLKAMNKAQKEEVKKLSAALENYEDRWPEVASLFTGLIGTQQWKDAIERAKEKYIIIKKQ